MKKNLLLTMAILTIGSFMSCSSDDDGNVKFYDNETDNYSQDHYQRYKGSLNGASCIKETSFQSYYH